MSSTNGDTTDLLAIRRGDLLSLVKAAERADVHTREARYPLAAGIAQFLHQELVALSERPAICQYCHADGEYPGGVCADHFEDACEQRKADVLEASGVRF